MPGTDGGAVATFDEHLHPRGPDGRFIKKGTLAPSPFKRAARRALDADIMAPRRRRPRGAERPPARPGELRRLTDQQLADLFHEMSIKDSLDEAALLNLADEMDRRDQRPAPVSPVQARRDLRVDQLVANGWEYRDAWAEAHGLDSDELARQERAALVDTERRPGERREQTVRRLYREWVHLQWIAAEKATRGHMLTVEARARGVDVVSLFSGPAARARKWASEDLKRWWAEHPRVTYTEFRASMLGGARDRRAAELVRGRGNDRDFGL